MHRWTSTSYSTFVSSAALLKAPLSFPFQGKLFILLYHQQQLFGQLWWRLYERSRRRGLFDFNLKCGKNVVKFLICIVRVSALFCRVCSRHFRCLSSMTQLTTSWNPQCTRISACSGDTRPASSQYTHMVIIVVDMATWPHAPVRTGRQF